MLGRTFRTIKNNPKILLLFAAMYAVPILMFVVAAFSFFPELNNMSTNYAYDNPEFFANFMIIYVVIMGVSFISGIAMVTVVLPPIFNYVYEACAGINTEGWYKRGVKRSWWKLIVLFIIYTAMLFPVMFGVMFFIILLERLFWIAMILMYVIMIAITIYMYIAMAAIIAEEDFGKALGNTFTLGSRYFFRMLGTTILVMIPSFILSGIFSGIQMAGFMTDSFNFTSYIISMLFTFVYGIFAYAYLYTYSMNSYLNEKGMFYTPAPDVDLNVEAAENMVIEANIERMDR